ncbi:MAG: thiamine phosphate synthase [Thermodesulfobacteriota bacterium]|nr:thiamine phosphate synthase [Thermodesulfobacteriota bacterium]
MKGLYLVTDRGLCGDRSLEDVVLRSVRGGARYVQIREKDQSTGNFIKEALRIKKILEPFSVPLIINDRVDVALAVKADGVHVGQDDMPYKMARSLMGPGTIIGLSVETWKDVEEAEALECNYIGVSPVFETPTKTDTKSAWGLDGMARIRAFSRHPLVAIGGLNASNVADVVKAGADCVAVVSAICAADDPEAASRELAGIIVNARKKWIVDNV